MFDLDTSIHIVGHVLVADCVEDFRLVAFHICYLLDRANVHEILALMT